MTDANNKALAKNAGFTTLKDLLAAKQTEIQKVLPQHMSAERMVKIACMAVSRNPLLQQCTLPSLAVAVMTAAELGLEPTGGPLGEGYLVPFKNGQMSRDFNRDVYEAVFIPGYRGLAGLARRACGAEIEARCVFEGDEFEWALGTDTFIRHVPGGVTDDAKITHAYAVASFTDGRKPKIEVMTREQVEKVRKTSKQPNGFLWQQHYHEACRKTCVRRIVKYLDMRPEYKAQMERALAANDQEYDFSDPPEATSRLDALADHLSNGGQTFVPEDAKGAEPPSLATDLQAEADERDGKPTAYCEYRITCTDCSNVDRLEIPVGEDPGDLACSKCGNDQTRVTMIVPDPTQDTALHDPDLQPDPPTKKQRKSRKKVVSETKATTTEKPPNQFDNCQVCGGAGWRPLNKGVFVCGKCGTLDLETWERVAPDREVNLGVGAAPPKVTEPERVQGDLLTNINKSEPPFAPVPQDPRWDNMVAAIIGYTNCDRPTAANLLGRWLQAMGRTRESLADPETFATLRFLLDAFDWTKYAEQVG